MVAWTTTPWTLPSNLALCVNPGKDYVKVREKESGAIYILMEARICELYKDPEAYEVLAKFKGSVLEGKRYEPLFDYFASMESRGAFRVLIDGYVTEDSGTGVVHQAPGKDFERCFEEMELIELITIARLLVNGDVVVNVLVKTICQE